MAASVQPQSGFIGQNGQAFQPGPASWVPQPGQPGMPQPGQNPLQNPFTAQNQPARGPVPQGFQQQFAPPGSLPHPSAFMQDAGFIGAPPPGMQFQNQPQNQPGWQTPSPFGGQQGATPQNPGAGQLPGQIPVVNPWAQFQQQTQQPTQQQFGRQIEQQQFSPQQQGSFVQQPLPHDPSLPQELQGRSFGEMLALYNGMKNVVLRYANGQQQVPQQQGAQQQQTQQQAPQQQGATQQGVPQGAEFWRDPAGNISRLVQEQVTQALNTQVAPMLAPVTQQANMAAIQFARQQVAAEIPGFPQLEPEIWQRLATADPRTLANPEIWRITAKNVAFDAMMRGQFQFPRGGGQFPPQALANGQNPLPNLNGFFTEQPGQLGSQRQGGPQQITEQQAFVARQMGMTPEAYLAWSGGTNQQPLNGGRR